jgi:hypothetical protein
MIAAFATLSFLVVIWLVAVVGAAILKESGAKIAAALKGGPAAPPIACSAARIRMRARPPHPARLRTRLRAAA